MGDLGLSAYQFIDFLAESGQQFWQVLPLGPTGYGNSPYASYSALAGNHFLISPDKLLEEGLLTPDDLQDIPGFHPDRVEYDRAIPYKLSLLQKACQRFQQQDFPTLKTEFRGFCQNQAEWLEDYALFMALREAKNYDSWHTWEPALAKREPQALAQAKEELTEQVFFHQFLQFEFFRQWSSLKNYANLRHIQIIGDIPIYVAHDSADVWSHPEIFSLEEETLLPAMMAGVPPDYFSATGQLWGNPVYNWERIQKDGFSWWVRRFELLLNYVDIIRIDHFRGFEAYWAVPQGEETAMNGEWVKAPGEEFFEVLGQKLGKLPILAEDLGVITPEVEALRDRFEFPGMKIIQFAFGSDPGNGFLPFNYSRNCVVYTGTHDNDTTVGWFQNLSDYEKNNLLAYLGGISPDGVHWDLIRLALSSIANQAILPLQDLLGLGTDTRMNFPGKAEGNWDWRYRPEALYPELRDRLKALTILFGRAPQWKQP